MYVSEGLRATTLTRARSERGLVERRWMTAKPSLLVPPAAPRVPFEVLAVRAGDKPALLLCVARDREARALAWLDGLEVVRREIAVSVGRGDAWQSGGAATMVELFASRDRALAERACALQADEPTHKARALVELLDYPPCSVDAFTSQPSRHDNSENRRASARRTRAPMPWRWELRNHERMIVPFFPCTYACEPAAARASSALASLATSEPVLAEEIARQQRGAVLYVDHDRQLALDEPELRGGALHFARARLSWSGGMEWDAHAAAIAEAGLLELDDEACARVGALTASVLRFA